MAGIHLRFPIALILAGAGLIASLPTVPAADGDSKSDKDLDWWSLKPVELPTVPPADAWCRNELDRFVLAGLKEQKLSPSPMASPRVLIRRLSYDLTGLPPTPPEIGDFLAASEIDAELAYRQLVDRLLASPHYGEHWARHWLDVARYGETHGYDKDKARFNAWPYRDYVIRSLNEDKPYARFVREQVAGDVLWPGKPDGIVALGFVAAGPWDHIAHSEVGETKVDGRIAKHMDRDDMVSAVFNTFMSTTVQCAQCHDHKGDPISMVDYYRLHTLFAAVDRFDRVYDLDPGINAERLSLEESTGVLDAKLKAIEAELALAGGERLKGLREQVSELKARVEEQLKTVAEHGYHSSISQRPDEVKWVQIDLGKVQALSEVRLIGAHDNYNDIGAGFGFPRRFRVEISDDAHFSERLEVLADHSKGDYANPGIAPVVIDAAGRSGRFVRVTATKLAERRKDYIFALGEIQIAGPQGDNLAGAEGVTVSARDSIEAPGRWQRDNLIDGKFATSSDSETLNLLAARAAELSTLMAKLETPAIRQRRDSLSVELIEKRTRLEALPKGKRVYSIATQFKASGKVIPTGGTPRTIHLLRRGDIRTPGDEMQPGAPALWREVGAEFSLPADHSEGDRRAALANYLVDERNPLTWRSIVNRIWLYHMERGIVDSPNDFGRMGMEPTHPELLDWMAVKFRDDYGGSWKALHRLIVTSATYRQVATGDPEKAKIDAGNRYYWRMERHRLTAEELRDSVLAVAGVLDSTMGGPSFHDFEFEDDHTPKYWYDRHDPNDPKSHRRSIYRLIARSQTQPFLTTLDCADPSQMVASRDETTTALQALALMNNPFMVAMSEQLAKRVSDSGTPLADVVSLVTGREPRSDELELLKVYAEQHGLAAACRLILNLNEFVYVD